MFRRLAAAVYRSSQYGRDYYGGVAENLRIDLTATCVDNLVVRLDWTSPPDEVACVIRRGTLGYPEDEHSGELVRSGIINGGYLEDAVPSGGPCYYRIFGRKDETTTRRTWETLRVYAWAAVRLFTFREIMMGSSVDEWKLYGEAKVSVATDHRSQQSFLEAIPRTFLTGGAVFDPIPEYDDGVDMLRGMAWMFDLLKSDCDMTVDYPDRIADELVMPVLRGLGYTGADLGPTRMRSLLGSIRTIHARRGTDSGVGRLAYALTGCRATTGQVANMLLCLNDSVPAHMGDSQPTCSMVRTGAAPVKLGGTVPALALPDDHYLIRPVTSWGWQLTPSKSPAVLTSVRDTTMAWSTDYLIPVTAYRNLHLSTHVYAAQAGGEVTLKIHWLDERGNESLGNPAKHVFAPTGAGWVRTGFTATIPDGAELVGWTVQSTVPVTISATQMSYGKEARPYRDPRSVPIHLHPARTNLAINGGAEAGVYGWESTTGTVAQRVDGQESDMCALITPGAGLRGQVMAPVDNGSDLAVVRPGSVGWGIHLRSRDRTGASITLDWGSGKEVHRVVLDPLWRWFSGVVGIPPGVSTVRVVVELDEPDVPFTADNLLIEETAEPGASFDGTDSDCRFLGEAFRSPAVYYPELSRRLAALNVQLDDYIIAEAPYFTTVAGEPEYEPEQNQTGANVIMNDPRVAMNHPYVEMG